MKNKELKRIHRTKRQRKQKNITQMKMLLIPHDVSSIGACRPSVATYPSAGGRRVTRGMRVPRKEYARSRHQRLFEENVGKTGKDAIYELLSERFGSCIYVRGRYQHPTRPSQGTAAFNRMCKHDFDFYVPFYVLISFLYFSFFVVDKGVSLCSYVFLNCDEEIRPTQFFFIK